MRSFLFLFGQKRKPAVFQAQKTNRFILRYSQLTLSLSYSFRSIIRK